MFLIWSEDTFTGSEKESRREPASMSSVELTSSGSVVSSAKTCAILAAELSISCRLFPFISIIVELESEI